MALKPCELRSAIYVSRLFRAVGSLIEYQKTHRINQLGIFTNSGEIIKNIRNEIQEILGNSVSMAAAIPSFLEIFSSGESYHFLYCQVMVLKLMTDSGKAQAVEKVAKCLRLSMDEIASLGDGENDIELLK